LADRIVVMGVAGSGKSTIGASLGRALAMPFLDGDDFHDPTSRAKMRAGVPLTDRDRAAWLDRLAALLAARPRVVLACSALRRAYRDRLRAQAPDLVFLHLDGDFETLLDRLDARQGHYFAGEAMLRSQFDTLEAPRSEPGAYCIDARQSPDAVLADILAVLEAADPDAEAP
jgi:gluconokinase